MSTDFAAKTVGELENIVANHRLAGKTDGGTFSDALRALDGRRHKGFDLQTSCNFLIEAARRHEYVSYKDVAAANGLDWLKARRPMNRHLDAVCEYAFSKKLPLLTAIVVNVEGVHDGTMKPEARAGFMSIVKRLGIRSDDDETFVRAEQQRVFDRFSGGEVS